MFLHLRAVRGPSPAKALHLHSPHLLRAAAADPPLVFLVPHADGWYVLPVAAGLEVNDRPLAAAVPLGVGDRIGLGPAGVLEVEGADVDDPRPPAFDPGDPGTTCRALGRSGRAAARDGFLLIGGPGCRLVPDSPEPVAAVARVAGRWVLYALNRDDLRTPGEPHGAAGWVPLRDGDEYRVGGRVLAFDILAADAAADADAEEEADGEPEPAAPAPVTPGPSGGSPPPPPADGGKGTDEVAVADTQYDPTAEAARRVCAWVNQAQKEPGRRAAPPVVPPGVDGRVRAAARAVLADPLGRAGLARFADLLRDLGYDDLYRHALRRLRFVTPQDAAVNRRLAESYLAAGQDSRRPPPERAQLLDEAEMYRAKASAIAPADRELGRLATEIAAQRTIALFGTQSAGAGGRADDE